MKLYEIPAQMVMFYRKVRRRILRELFKPMFRSCGSQVSFDPDDFFAYANIRLGNDVFIGSGACFATITEITIGNHVMFGPNVTIRGGNHNTELSGKPMSMLKHKREGDDLPVHIDDDVWVGCDVVILKGVTIGRGAVVGAGSVVTKSVPPYGIVVGLPARVVAFRGDADAIRAHEEECYSPDERLALESIPFDIVAKK